MSLALPLCSILIGEQFVAISEGIQFLVKLLQCLHRGHLRCLSFTVEILYLLGYKTILLVQVEERILCNLVVATPVLPTKFRPQLQVQTSIPQRVSQWSEGVGKAGSYLS